MTNSTFKTFLISTLFFVLLFVNKSSGQCVFEIETAVFLEGPAINPNLLGSYTIPMRNDLNALGVLPGQAFMDPFFGMKYTPSGQPYNMAPWNYMGTEGDAFDSEGDQDSADANYPSTVVDWVLVSIWDVPGSVNGSMCDAAAQVHADGHIEFVKELTCCDLIDLNSYYIVIEHRNHLIVMSHEPVIFINNKLTYDFRIQQSYLDDPFNFGLYSRQKEIMPGVFAMIAGNGDQTMSIESDTDINFDDRTTWSSQNGSLGKYSKGNYNLTGDTNFNDRTTWEKNNSKFTSVPRN